MTTEEWRPVAGWEEYLVSDLGRVVSHKGREPRLLRPFLIGGYPRVTLCAAGVRRIFSVHHLVATTFIGPRPDGLEVRHLDGDPMNPRLTNLSYGTKSQNMLDAVAHGTHPQASKTHCPQDHEYTAENTYMYGGRRYCRACSREHSRTYVQRQRLRAAGIKAA